MTYNKEERYEIRYEVQTAGGNWKEKVVYGKSKDWYDRNRAKCKELGYRIVRASKLYPFNTEKNQHNFELIDNICFNTMHDMDMGEIEYNEAEYNRLYETREKAERFFCLPLPIAWIPWEDWKDAKELATAAVLHRERACIESGHTEWLQYCR